MKKLLAVAAVAEVGTGMAFAGCSIPRRQPVIRRGHCGYRSRDKSLRRRGPDRIGCCLLALRVCIPCTLRDVDLQFACDLRSSLPRSRRQVERPASVAGSCVACTPDAASRTGLVQAIRERTNVTTMA